MKPALDENERVINDQGYADVKFITLDTIASPIPIWQHEELQDRR